MGDLTRFTIDVGEEEVAVLIEERVDGVFENRMGWTVPRSAWPDQVLTDLAGPMGDA